MKDYATRCGLQNPKNMCEAHCTSLGQGNDEPEAEGSSTSVAS